MLLGQQLIHDCNTEAVRFQLQGDDKWQESISTVNDLHGAWLGIVQYQVDPRLTINSGVLWESQGPYRKAVTTAVGRKVRLHSRAVNCRYYARDAGTIPL